MQRKFINKLRVPYALAVYGKEEIAAVGKALCNPVKITPGIMVKKFEQKIAGIFGKKYGVMVNSGSSANLLALEVLNLPEGSEVITPILTFATTLAPIIQKRLAPVFVDVEPGTYLVNIDQIEARITKKTRALMIPSLIGNIPDLIRLKKIAKKYNLFFIEDSCDTLGASFAGRPTGYYSDISTTSFYASHIITAGGGGGMICFHIPQLAKRALVMSSWGRESSLFGAHEKSEDLKKRFAGRLDNQTYDAKFIFSEIGYNFQSTEMNAVFGLEQLNRLPIFTKRRQFNFANLHRFFKQYAQFFILPIQDPRTDTNWLAFPLTIRSDAGFSRYALTKYLENHNIQTRPVFTGNVLKQPAFQNLKKYKQHRKNFPVTDYIMQNAFLIGCHQGLEQKHLEYLQEVFAKFLNKYS